jgi:hypothetical protein
MSQSDIEKNWEVSKILVTENAQPNYLAYKLGSWEIYVHKMKSIITDIKRSTYQLPMLVEVRSKEKVDIQAFILGEKQFRAYRIFKHGEGFYKMEDCIGLVANTMKSMLHHFKEPTTFYIDCKSEGLRKAFYEMGERINTEDQTRHTFDFETYDYKLIIKKYDTYIGEDNKPFYTGSQIFTAITGKDMQNTWNQEE